MIFILRGILVGPPAPHWRSDSGGGTKNAFLPLQETCAILLYLEKKIMSERIVKVNDLLRDLVSQALTRETSLKPGVILTVSKVSTSKDLRHAHIKVSIFPEKETRYAEKALANEWRHIEKYVHQKLYMKPLPKLRFTLDITERDADEVEKILLREDF
jgi:ribosome-binding factor A